MNPTTIARVELLEEAKALETAGGTWEVRHVCAVLGCHRATLYRHMKWLLSRAICGPGARLSFYPSDVRFALANLHGPALRRASGER